MLKGQGGTGLQSNKDVGRKSRENVYHGSQEKESVSREDKWCQMM